MNAYELYVPQTYNDGRAVPEGVLNGLRGRMLDVCGGYTENPNPMVGVWRDPADGTVYQDVIRVYTLFADTTEQITGLAAEVAVTLDQVAVSVVTPDRQAIFVGRPHA